MRLAAILHVCFASLTCGRRTARVVERKKGPLISAWPERAHLMDSGIPREAATQSVNVNMASKLNESPGKGLHSLASFMLATPAVGFNTGRLFGPSHRVGPRPRMATLGAVRGTGGPMENEGKNFDGVPRWPEALATHGFRPIQKNDDGNYFDGMLNWPKSLASRGSYAMQNNEDANYFDAEQGDDRIPEHADGNYFDGLLNWPKSLPSQGSGVMQKNEDPIVYFDDEPNRPHILTTSGSDRIPANDAGNYFDGMPNWPETLMPPQGSDRIPVNDDGSYFDGVPNWPESLMSQGSGVAKEDEAENDHGKYFDGMVIWPESLISPRSHA